MSLLTTARGQIKSILQAEFGSSLLVVDSWLHPSEGRDRAIAGTYPLRTVPQSNNMHVLNAEIGVQVFQRWQEEVEPSKRVNPSSIESWEKRFRDRIHDTTLPSTEGCWFFNVGQIDFPPDPTGHRTRFEAVISVYGDNPTLMETA